VSLVLALLGEQKLLEATLKDNVADLSLQYGLFTNDFTPARASVIGNVTEATGSGYARVTKAGTAWGSATVATPSIATTTTRASFIWSGVPAAATMYGYFIRTTAGVLVGAERFATPFVVTQAGSRIDLTCKFKLWDEKDINSGEPVTFGANGVALLLDHMTSKTNPETTIKVEFYNNDYTPSDSTMLADLTFPPSGANLWAEFFVSTDWNSSVAEGLASYSWTAKSVANASYTGTLYGWSIKAPTAGRLHCVRRFDTPWSTAPGQSYTYAMKYTLRDYNYTP
jgi:hypothetical protein